MYTIESRYLGTTPSIPSKSIEHLVLQVAQKNSRKRPNANPLLQRSRMTLTQGLRQIQTANYVNSFSIPTQRSNQRNIFHSNHPALSSHTSNTQRLSNQNSRNTRNSRLKHQVYANQKGYVSAHESYSPSHNAMNRHWVLLQQNIHDIPVSVWKRVGKIHWNNFTKHKLSQHKQGYIESVFPTRSEMKPDSFNIDNLWFTNMEELPKDYDFESLDQFIFSQHCVDRESVLALLKEFESEIELLRAVFVLGCKFGWDSYDIKSILNELNFSKIWVCEGVLRIESDVCFGPQSNDQCYNPSKSTHYDIIDTQSDMVPSAFNNELENVNRGFKYKRHAWNVIQIWNGQNLQYFIMDTILGRVTSAQPLQAAPLSQGRFPTYSNTKNVKDHMNSFWFFLPSKMLKFSHFAARISNRELLTGYKQLLPDFEPIDIDQSSAEEYPQSVQEFQRGPHMTLKAISLGIFPRNEAARMSHQIVSNYVYLEYDTLNSNEFDIEFEVKSLDSNPTKESYHIWESYPRSCKLLVHILFKTKGIYSIQMNMKGKSHIVGDPFVHTYTYNFYVKKGMSKDVGGLNPSVLSATGIHDALFRVESPLQRYLEGGSVYNFQVLADTSTFSTICLLLSEKEPGELVELTQKSKYIDLDSKLQLFEGSVVVDKYRKTIHLVAFTHNDKEKTHAVHISTWDILPKLKRICTEVHEANIPDTWNELPFETFPLYWIETSQSIAENSFISCTSNKLLVVNDTSDSMTCNISKEFNFEDDIILSSTMMKIDSKLRNDEELAISPTTVEKKVTTSNSSNQRPNRINEDVTLEEKLRFLLPPRNQKINNEIEMKPQSNIESNESSLELGQYYFDSEMYEDAIREWKEVVKTNPDAEIFYKMSVASKQLQDERKTEKYLSLAADYGYLDAMKLMAGHSIWKQNIPMAIKYLQSASDEGDIEATYELATYLTSNPQVQRDLWRAFQLFKKAADYGHNDAKYITGLFYCEGIEGKLPLDYEQAYSYFFDSGELNNHAPSLTAIGWLYEHEMINSDRCALRALEYYEKAANIGEATAMYNCGILYLQNSDGVPLDETKALHYLEMASNHGIKNIDKLKIQLRLKLEYEEELSKICEYYKENSKLPKLSEGLSIDTLCNNYIEVGSESTAPPSD